jgi:hypothetical protein
LTPTSSSIGSTPPSPRSIDGLRIVSPFSETPGPEFAVHEDRSTSGRCGTVRLKWVERVSESPLNQWWRGLPARAGAASQWARCPLHHRETRPTGRMPTAPRGGIGGVGFQPAHGTPHSGQDAHCTIEKPGQLAGCPLHHRGAMVAWASSPRGVSLTVGRMPTAPWRQAGCPLHRRGAMVAWASSPRSRCGSASDPEPPVEDPLDSWGEPGAVEGIGGLADGLGLGGIRVDDRGQ